MVFQLRDLGTQTSGIGVQVSGVLSALVVILVARFKTFGTYVVSGVAGNSPTVSGSNSPDRSFLPRVSMPPAWLTAFRGRA